MANVRYFIQPTPVVTSSSVQTKCENHLFKRLKWISKPQSAESQSPPPFVHHVKECVVSNSHLAFLLEDGHVYRQKFGQSVCEDVCSDDESACNLLTPEQRHSQDLQSPASVNHSARSSRSTPSHHRLRPIMRSRERRVMMERWGALSGSGHVPEELIDQAMNVLQGKSRDVVRRELMRTNLDVNLAVNNLLSHEDDVADDQDGEESLPVIPSGDDLLSFLASSGASHRIAAAMDDEASATEGAMSTALRRYHEEEQSMYNETSSMVPSQVSKKKKKKLSASGGGNGSSSSATITTPQLCYSGDKEWLTVEENGQTLLFAHIASLYSELIAVTTTGQLCQWKWSSSHPYQEGNIKHPRVVDLGLLTEEIHLLSASHIRATVLTTSMKFAVFYDETVAFSTSPLEHSCTPLNDLISNQHVLCLQTNSLFSAVLTTSGKIYWWGVLPLGEQKQQLEKWQEERLNDRSDRKEIKEGDKVMMRSRPLCSVGMKAVVLKHGCPVVGVLQESVFSLHEKYRFKLLRSSSDPPTELTVQPSVRAGMKRTHISEGEGLGEVICTMHDVIMIEDGRCSSGTVLKVDGVYAAVTFSQTDEKEHDTRKVLGNCRLFRIDQLTAASHSQLPSPFQFIPKKLKLPSTCKPLALGIDQSGITVILSTSNGIHRCTSVNLLTGCVSEKGHFPQVQMNYFTKQNKLQLHSVSAGVWLLEDENGGLFPLAKDHIGGIKNFPFIPIAPVQSVSIGRISNKSSVVCVVMKEQQLVNSILSNTKHFHNVLLRAYDQGANSNMFNECCAGGYNFLHLLSSCFLPAPLTVGCHLPLSQRSGRHTTREGIRDLMRRANYLAAMGLVGSVSSSSRQESDEDVHYHDNPTVTSEQLVFMLHEDCKENKTCQEVLHRLLQQRNIEGDTPFMTAVRCRNYPTAIKLMKISLLLSAASPDPSSLLSMLYPDGSHPDDNPVFVLCHNEPCSYTWTGRDHIMQDVYECYNCGLTGSLCCCTECAFTCHRGHNCCFKRVSPSAYCDCSEKCVCHSLTEGSNPSRLELFKLLLDHSELAAHQNTRGEHVFDLLVSMEARSNHDHVPWSIRSEGRRTKPEDSSMFIRKALIYVAKQWSLVKSSLAAGLEPGKPVASHQGNSEGRWLLTVVEKNRILSNQCEVQHLDILTYHLTAKLPRMYLNMLMDTMMKSYLANRDETVLLVKRFLRSVARVYLVVWLDNLVPSGDHLSSSEHCDKPNIPAAMERCNAVFESFSSLAIPELAQMCSSLVVPISLGTCVACVQSSLNDRPAKGGGLANELFKLPSVSLLRHNLEQSAAPPLLEVGVASDDASDDETNVALSGRARLGGALLPYFRSVLCSSGESSIEELEESSSDSEHEAMEVDDRPPAIPSHSKDEHWAMQNRNQHVESASNNSATLLSRAFERLLGEVTFLLGYQRVVKGKPQLPGKIPIDLVDEAIVWEQLQGIWRWLGSVMDTMECQLRTGEAILSSSLARHKSNIKKSQQNGRRLADSNINDGKGLFSQYMLSVLCWRSGEHANLPPVLDIVNMEHVAWILDGLLHFMMHSGASTTSSYFPQVGQEMKLNDEAVVSFFNRSASVSCLGMPPISPFASIDQSLPLAEWPQLLTAKASRDLLFHTSSQCLEVWPNCRVAPPPIASLISNPLMTSTNSTLSLTDDQIWGVDSKGLGASVLMGRWCMSCDLLHQAFGSHLRGDHKSTLGSLGGFHVIEKLFRREMEQYENNGSYKDSTELLVSREPSKLLSQVLEFLYNQRKSHPHSLTGPLAHVKVIFADEPGQGTGVTRSLLTAIASCLLTEERLPSLDHIYEHGGKSIVPAYSQLFGGEQSCSDDTSPPTKWLLGHESSDTSEQDNGQGPLFYQPGRVGFYSIHYGNLTMARLEAFHTVGNLIGYSLMMREMFPLPLCRHILKYILQQPVCWEDFAFFDPVMYETFRQLVLDAKKDTAVTIFDSLALNFRVLLSKEEGGKEYDLIPNGALQAVTPDNVLHYVSRYAYLRMVHMMEEPLQSIVEGIRDVIPSSCSSFCNLTPEDLRLLLNGTCQVDTELLKSITTFSDESHKSTELVEQFKGWFWLLVERMSNKERQDLLYFWTSSPVTPPTPEGYHPIPTITIRPIDDHHLPTANTCISRLYIPLYSSKNILKSKLLLAIKTKYFGFV